MTKTIIISNRLPITVKYEQERFSFQKSAGGLASGLSSIAAEGESIWIGWPGNSFEDDIQEVVKQQLKGKQMIPVFLSEREVKDFYEGFSNSVIWPNFHYFNEHIRIEQEYWEAYEQVNQKFCEALKEIYEPGDLIWIHDYHLMLLPGMIRREIQDIEIGFFLHIPFPSFELFRVIPWREQILEGILGADLIGFQTYDDVGHFADCVRRLIGKDAVMGEIKHDNRITMLDAFPIGIDYSRYEKSPDQKTVKTEIEKLKSTFSDIRLILSVDRLDYSKGIRERLRTLDLFLEKYPEYREKVSLLIVMVPSRDQVLQYQNLKEEIDELVGKINGKYGVLGWHPVHYLYKQQPFKSLSALYAISDVAMVTPLRDGMNLVCKEYVASRQDQTGVLILSERAGAARTLTDAIRVNPDNIYQMADALHEALSMPLTEQRARIARMQLHLKKYDIFHWAASFIERLKQVKSKHLESANPKQLHEQALPAYQQANKRLLLLDYDGTLVGFKANPADAVSDSELHNLIEPLLDGTKNALFIVTGRDRRIIDEWFPDHRVNIIAEHGIWIREHGEWRKLFDPDADWKEHILPILELYLDRTPGSILEQKEHSYAWHYRKTNELGELRARELTTTLNYFTHNMNVQILQGNKVIEVKSSLINKGLTVKSLFLERNWDFILSIGDDTTDEDMFRVLPADAFTVKVGDSQTDARFKIHSWREVRSFLKKMHEPSQSTA
ncbi:MAG: bifunctional alpha,alpha-trehalose-phosphate synthase (UDP-forming)/trehalose-phosphatase [Bacteroidia bacterium]|jgi:trehalose 6-phosphate synthase/phosphatase